MTDPPPPTRPPRPLREALLVFALVTLATAALWHLSRFVGLVRSNLHALVAICFLYAPVAVANRRKENLEQYGFSFRPVGKSLAVAGGAMLVLFPPFLAVFYGFYHFVCAPEYAATLGKLALPSLCRVWLDWDGARLALPRGFLEMVLAQVVVVALPEELFFRGYLQKRLSEAFPARRKLLGGEIGLALVLSAVLFALGHVLVDLDPRRFVVFFPGLLFGWMRSATGSIFAGTVVHASANLYMEILHASFFR